MATPYFQLLVDTVPSTQDVARDAADELPVLVMARAQTAGRGRSGSEWINADRALAASLALHVDEGDRRPFSLMAGIAAARATVDARLKWPNDVLRNDVKVGGILVERVGSAVVVGLGLNLWWDVPPSGIGSLYDDDPGDGRYSEVGALWGAELMRIISGTGWPADEYRSLCATIGAHIRWQPEGEGVALDVADDGGLVVTANGETEVVRSGEVRHIRPGS